MTRFVTRNGGNRGCAGRCAPHRRPVPIPNRGNRGRSVSLATRVSAAHSRSKGPGRVSEGRVPMSFAVSARRVRSGIKTRDVIGMARISSLRLAGLAAAVLSLTIVAAGPAAARHPPGHTGGAPGSGYEAPIPAPVQSVTDNSDRTLQWVLFAAAVAAGLAVVAVVADVLGRRRWRQPPLE